MTIQIGTIELLALLAVWALVAYIHSKCEQGGAGADSIPGNGIGQQEDGVFENWGPVCGFKPPKASPPQSETPSP